MKITRAAVILLGRRESAVLLSPHMAELTWKLVGEESAFQHFSPPFLVTATELVKRIRNVQIRFNPPNELIYREIETDHRHRVRRPGRVHQRRRVL